MRLVRRVTLFTTAVLLVIGAGRLAAHHGWTGYDEQKPLTLTGTVKAAAYENPHSFVDLQVSDKDRKSTRLNSSHIQKSRMPSSA